MKIIYSLILCCIGSANAQSQIAPFINFEDTTPLHQYYYTDTLLDPKGVWQIGAPHKPYFDSAYSKPNAAVTLLDSALPPNTKASFVVNFTEQNNWSYFGNVISFKHKFDLKNHTSGGYVEFSVDTGVHWHGIGYQKHDALYYTYFGVNTYCIQNAWEFVTFEGYNFIYPTYISIQLQDSTASGNPYFTGLDTIWRTDTIAFPTPIPLKTNQTLPHLLFKFTVFSDSSSVPQSGWMIDDILFNEHGVQCIGGINDIPESHLHIVPNPVLDAFTIIVCA